MSSCFCPHTIFILTVHPSVKIKKKSQFSRSPRLPAPERNARPGQVYRPYALLRLIQKDFLTDWLYSFAFPPRPALDWLSFSFFDCFFFLFWNNFLPSKLNQTLSELIKRSVVSICCGIKTILNYLNNS